MIHGRDKNELFDDALVGFAAAEMRAKLEKARAKGRAYWFDPHECEYSQLRVLLEQHVAKNNPGNLVDIAVLAMMLHYRDVFGDFL